MSEVITVEVAEQVSLLGDFHLLQERFGNLHIKDIVGSFEDLKWATVDNGAAGEVVKTIACCSNKLQQ